MASRTSNAWDATADGRSSVASELDAIFASLPRITAAAEPSRPARSSVGRRRRLRPSILFLLAVALAALVGSLAFLMPVVRQRAASHAPPASVAKPAAIAVAPVLAAPTASAPLTPPAARTNSPAAIEADSPPPAQARTGPKAAVPTRRRAPSAARHGGCSRFASQAWCLRGSISGADDRLRDAYDDAVRAGVPRDILVDVRSDWKRLRGRANRDPQALIRGYSLLTQELRAEIRRGR